MNLPRGQVSGGGAATEAESGETRASDRAEKVTTYCTVAGESWSGGGHRSKPREVTRTWPEVTGNTDIFRVNTGPLPSTINKNNEAFAV